MRRALSLVLLLAGAAGCQKNVSTPPGTQLLEWQRSQASLPEVASAREVGPRTTKDVKLRARPHRKGTATFAVHVETASIELGEEGRKTPRATAVAVRITAERNQDWTLTAKCDGPSYRAPSYAAAVVDDLLLSCSVDMRYQDTFNNLQTGLVLEIAGDGSIQPTIQDGTVTPD